MQRRMLRYYNDIKIQFETLEVLQYIIYIGKAKLSMKDRIKENKLDYSYSIIDMHNIDCEELLALDTPDALVLSILCDFKGKDELGVLLHITSRLAQLTEDDEHKLGKYMLMLETLSDNRDLQAKLKEAEEMLREIRYEKLPSYEIGMERGFSNGVSEGIVKTAITMISKFKLSVEDVASELNISLDELKKHLK